MSQGIDYIKAAQCIFLLLLLVYSAFTLASIRDSLGVFGQTDKWNKALFFFLVALSNLMRASVLFFFYH